VVIKTVANNRYPVISQNVTVKKIELSDWTAGELTVTNGAVLTVSTHFLLKGAAYLLLDNGTLQFNGSGNFSNNSISMPWGASKIEISNNGVLNCPDQLFDIRSEVVMNSGTMNLGSGLTIQNGILFKVVTGNVNVYGAYNLDGILDGGAGHFVFNGSPSNSTHQVHIGSDGYFICLPPPRRFLMPIARRTIQSLRGDPSHLMYRPLLPEPDISMVVMPRSIFIKRPKYNRLLLCTLTTETLMCITPCS
jgi:hypothetical protein